MELYRSLTGLYSIFLSEDPFGQDEWKSFCRQLHRGSKYYWSSDEALEITDTISRREEHLVYYNQLMDIEDQLDDFRRDYSNDTQEVISDLLTRHDVAFNVEGRLTILS